MIEPGTIIKKAASPMLEGTVLGLFDDVYTVLVGESLWHCYEEDLIPTDIVREMYDYKISFNSILTISAPDQESLISIINDIRNGIIDLIDFNGIKSNHISFT